MDEIHKTKCEQIYLEGIMILAEDGHVDPTFFLIKNHESMVIQGIDFIREKKDEITELVTKIAKTEDADAMVFLSEAYQSTNLEYYKNPKEDPGVRNVFNLMYLTPDGKSKEIITGDVKKSIGGTPYVEEWEWMRKVDAIPFLKPWK